MKLILSYFCCLEFTEYSSLTEREREREKLGKSEEERDRGEREERGLKRKKRGIEKWGERGME